MFFGLASPRISFTDANENVKRCGASNFAKVIVLCGTDRIQRTSRMWYVVHVVHVVSHFLDFFQARAFLFLQQFRSSSGISIASPSGRKFCVRGD